MSILRTVSGVITLGCILFCGPALSFGADWALYYEDGMRMYHYDKGSVEIPRKGIVWVTTKTTLLGAQEGKVTRMEVSCNYRTFRVLSDKVDPVTGQFLPAGASGGYKWDSVPLQSRMGALYANLCE
jgi:hypothetical protein